MSKYSGPYTRKKFCFRWRGRRWYDPNERKVIWSTLGMACFTMAVKTLIWGLTSTHQTSLVAKSSPAHGIIGTAHDLSSTGLYQVTHAAEVCIFCHTPHGSYEGIKQLIPVWNHVTTTSQFAMYTSPSLKGAVDTQPMGPSLACLSCHDGTVAMGALHESPPGGGETDYSQSGGGVNRSTGMMQGANQLGNNLTSVHPISLSYRDDLNKSLRNPVELVGVRLYPSNAQGGKVHCGSCHDPHNFGVDGGTAPFLRVSKHGSSLCLSCHIM